MGPTQPRLQAAGSAPPAAGASFSGAPPGIPPGTDIRKQAFDFAADATKQLITVATGVIAATVIFSKDLDTTSRYLALASWVVLTFSVVCGIGALLFMTGNLHNSVSKNVSPTLSDDVHLCSKLQLGSFLAGIVMVMIFGFFAAAVKPPPDNKPMTINCVVPNPPAPVIIQVPTPSGQSQSAVKKGPSKRDSGKKQ